VVPDTTSTTTPEPTDTTTIESPTTSDVIDNDRGGELPQTATPLYLYLFGGFAFVLLGLVGLKLNSRI
jgi:hypothetical protein